MNISKTNIDELNAVIKLQIVKEDYESSVKNVLNDYRKKAKIDGFRPGKVPMGLIKKMYGTAILADEVNKVLSQELTKYITDNNLNIMGEPLPNESEQKPIDWGKDEEFEFAFDIAVSPEYTLNLSKRDKMIFHKILVDEKMIENGVEMHTRRFGSNQEADIVGEKELLKGSIVQVDAEGKAMEEGITADSVAISLEYMKDEEAKA
jgi:trigger factor